MLSRRLLLTVALVCVAGCTGAREPEASVVDVIVAAPSSSVAATSTATAAATVKIAADPSATSFALDDNPRRVLVPPPPLAPGSSLPPQTAVPLMIANAGMLTPLLSATTNAHASGAMPDGQPIAGAFKQGNTLHLPITLQPGRCYTVVGVSVGVTELDIALMIAPSPGLPFPPMALAIDSTTGPTAVIGPGSNCFKNPTPIAMPAVAVITATAGSGSVLAQAFSR